MTCTGRINVAATQIFGSLTIGGMLMHRLAFAVTDVTDLWLGPDVRGEDLMIPGRPGRIAFPRRADVTERQLPMVIDGRFDVSGNEFAGNEFEGLLQNIEYLRANVVDPTGVGDGTRAISLTRPGGGSPGVACRRCPRPGNRVAGSGWPVPGRPGCGRRPGWRWPHSSAAC